MSMILTPSRGDPLFGEHNPTYGPLQPSALPAPTSASPQIFKIASLSAAEQMEMTHQGDAKAARNEVVSRWVTRGNPLGSSREALAVVDINMAPSTSTQATDALGKLSSLYRRPSSAVPRPAPVPDVFASASTSRSALADPSLFFTKRTLDASSLSAANKRAKLAKLKAEASEKAQKVEEERWTAKWLKVFPGLHFYFELDAEDRTLKSKVLKLGGRIDAFFSQKVTHLIIKGGDSPQKAKPMAVTKRVESMKGSPRNPFIDHTGSTTLAEKAAQMSIKVWTVRKLEEMLSRLMPAELVAHDSLHALLEDEKVHGTRERDLNAPRPGYYYFAPGSKYLLVEDATGKNKVIMVKEYQHNQKSAPEYPILFETFMRQSSQAQMDTPVEKIRDRAWSLYVEREPFEGEEPPADLRRSTSLRSLTETPQLPTTQPYHNASGNSVSITSTIASTSNAQQSPAFVGGVPQLGTKDRAIMQLSKRVQVLKGNARLAAARHNESFKEPYPSHRRASSDAAPPLPPKAFMSQEQVLRMLQHAREPKSAEDHSVEARKRNRLKVEAGLKGKEQDTTAGYCENCRLKYNDLSVHIASKKHRRFATDPIHFAELDQLLGALRRPPNPILVTTEFPPCYSRHDKDDWNCPNCRIHWTAPQEPFSELTEGTEGYYGSDEAAREDGSEESGEYDEE